MKGNQTSDSNLFGGNQKNAKRECFYLEEVSNYFYEVNFTFSDIKSDIKQLIAKYSAGINLKEFDKTLTSIGQFQYKTIKWDLSNKADYYLAISLASIVSLRKKSIDKEAFRKLIPYEKDILIHFIFDGDQEFDLSKPILHHSPYVFLINYILKDEKQINTLDQFLLHFYKGLETTEWHNSHIGDHPAFFGYWSFSLAAIIQRLDIEDITFADHMFYPRDLQEKELFRTWEDSLRGDAAREKVGTLQDSYNKQNEWLDNYNNSMMNRVIPEKIKEIFKKQEEKLFSQAFLGKLANIGNSESETNKYENPKELRKLLTEFAKEIINSKEKQDEIRDAFSEEVIKEHLKEKLQSSFLGVPKQLQKDIEYYFSQKNAIEDLKAGQIDYEQLGRDILSLDEKYKDDDEEYWDSMEALMKKNNIMPQGISEQKIKDDVKAQIEKSMKKRTGHINFNVSLKDYL